MLHSRSGNGRLSHCWLVPTCHLGRLTGGACRPLSSKRASLQHVLQEIGCFSLHVGTRS